MIDLFQEPKHCCKKEPVWGYRPPTHWPVLGRHVISCRKCKRRFSDFCKARVVKMWNESFEKNGKGSSV